MQYPHEWQNRTTGIDHGHKLWAQFVCRRWDPRCSLEPCRRISQRDSRGALPSPVADKREESLQSCKVCWNNWLHRARKATSTQDRPDTVDELLDMEIKLKQGRVERGKQGWPVKGGGQSQESATEHSILLRKSSHHRVVKGSLKGSLVQCQLYSDTWKCLSFIDKRLGFS